MDLFGKTQSALQSGIRVGDDGITGTLNYVTGYTGYSGSAELQSGNFLALYFDVPGVSGVTYTAELVGGVSGPVQLDSDQTVVFRVTSTSQKVSITASKSGCESVTKLYPLSGLTLQPS